jgi:hypothetical protein
VTRDHCSETNPTNKAAIFAAWAAKYDELSDRITFLEPFAAPPAAIEVSSDVQLRPRRQRKPRPATVIKQIEKDTGKSVTGVTVAADGSITLTFGSGGKAELTTADDELERWRRKHAR